MRSVSALDVRKKFGQLLDEAAAGERLIIERAGQPVAAIVPLSDVPELNRQERTRRRLEALAEIRRYAVEHPVTRDVDAATLIRQQRDERAAQIMRNVERAHRTSD